MMMQMLGVVAEFERAMISERTKARIESAQRHEHQLSRPFALNASQRGEITRRVASGDWSQAEAARLFDVDRSTICRMMWLDG
ncbi:recombinase family protein [Myxococcota bacterium]|nr:recombinase family protein [Myxococcota bacterium]